MCCQMNTFLRRDTMTEIIDHVYKFVDCTFKEKETVVQCVFVYNYSLFF